MITILHYDPATAARALALPLDLSMRAALVAELAALTTGEHDLTDYTDIILIQPGDTDEDVRREAGFSPLVNPLSGARHGEPDFEPAWDLLTLRRGVFRMVLTYGSTFAMILLVPDVEGVLSELLDLCRQHAA